jgi:hypothetical protein
MSLYDSISKSLSTKAITAGIGDGINSALGDLKGALGNTPFGNAVANMGTSAARNAAVGLANKYIPSNMQRMIATGTGALGDIMNGDFSNAGLRVLDSGILNDLLPGMSGIGSQARFWGTPTPLFGGITPEEARAIYQEQQNTNFCRKNLWLIEVSSKLWGDQSSAFNMFATDIEYSPFTVTGEKRKLGSAHVDLVNSSDPVELRITTMDDINGSLKSWFKAHCAATASVDGTVGVPADYAVKIKIVHGFITQGSNRDGYEDIGTYRCGNIDISLSRKEDGLQELQMSFVQLDTFMAN